MIVKAIIKLQACRTKDRQAFVRNKDKEHGIAKGRISRYEVVGESWSHVRRVLKNFDVMGHSAVGPATVESWSKDIGHAYGKLSLVHPQDLIREVLHNHLCTYCGEPASCPADCASADDDYCCERCAAIAAKAGR